MMHGLALPRWRVNPTKAPNSVPKDHRHQQKHDDGRQPAHPVRRRRYALQTTDVRNSELVARGEVGPGPGRGSTRTRKRSFRKPLLTMCEHGARLY